MLSDTVVKKTSALLMAILLMAIAWSFMRLPGSNFQMVTFAVLSATALCNISGFELRLKRTFQMICATAILQFIISITANFPLIRVVISSLFSFVILLWIPNKRCAVTSLIAGFLALFAPTGLSAGLNRSIDIICSGLSVLFVTSLDKLSPDDTPPATEIPYTLKEAAIISAEIAIGFVIAILFKHEQANWIMLTSLFLHLSESPQSPLPTLAKHRIIATPLGILLAGLYLAGLVADNYRMIYIIPVTGTLGFFLLYLKNDYFMFTFLFMFTMTLFSDWMQGNYNRFHFAELMFSRTLATAIGGILILSGKYFMKEDAP